MVLYFDCPEKVLEARILGRNQVCMYACARAPVCKRACACVYCLWTCDTLIKICFIFMFDVNWCLLGTFLAPLLTRQAQMPVPFYQLNRCLLGKILALWGLLVLLDRGGFLWSLNKNACANVTNHPNR